MRVVSGVDNGPARAEMCFSAAKARLLRYISVNVCVIREAWLWTTAVRYIAKGRCGVGLSDT